MRDEPNADNIHYRGNNFPRMLKQIFALSMLLLYMLITTAIYPFYRLWKLIRGIES